jgi:LacI family transcriptional regulator
MQSISWRLGVVTIKDVAAHAGVSASTVSRALGGDVQVSPAARARIQQAITELHYQPNRMARNLRRRQSDTIGVVVSDIENPHFTRALRAIEDAAFSRGYRVILCNTDETPEKQRAYLEVLAAEQVVGVILVPADADDPTVSRLIDGGVPIVAFDRSVGDERADAVLADNHAAASQATQHLFDMGRKHIAFMAGRPGIQTGVERQAGYESVVARFGCPSIVGEGQFRLVEARQAMNTLLDTEPELDAVVVANNLMTIGVLNALYERGLRVPEDIAVVGIDDPPWAELVAPALTTLSQPTQLMATRAFELLIDRITGRRVAARFEVFQFQLNVRASSGGRHASVGREGSNSIPGWA